MKYVAWGSIVLLVGFESLQVAVAGCFKNTRWVQAIGCVVTPGMGAAGPCPRYPDLNSDPTVNTCGQQSRNVSVPGGTSGLEPTGLLTQTNLPTTCRQTRVCTARTVTVRVYPLATRTACIPGAWFTDGTASVFQAAGGACPAPPPPPPGPVQTAVETVE